MRIRFSQSRSGWLGVLLCLAVIGSGLGLSLRLVNQTHARVGQAGGKSALTSGTPLKVHLKQANPLPCERPLFNAPSCLALDSAGSLLISDA